MAHSAEIIGLAGFNLVGAILVELERQHPGSKSRILADARAAASASAVSNPSGNAAAILEVLNQI